MSTRAYVEHLEEYWGGQVPHELEDPDTITELFETGSVTVKIQGKPYILALDLQRVRPEPVVATEGIEGAFWSDVPSYSDGPQCNGQFRSYGCTLAEGHEGEHIAHGVQTNSEGKIIAYARWK